MIRPFPFDQLPSLTHDEVGLTASLHRQQGLWSRQLQALRALVPVELTTRVASIGLTTKEAALRDVRAGWFSALADAAGEDVAYLALDAPIGQTLASAVLVGAEAPAVEVRPLLAAEEACLDHLAGHLLAESGAALRQRVAYPEDLLKLEQSRIGRIVIHITIGQVSGWLAIWAVLERWKQLSTDAQRIDGLNVEVPQRSALWSGVRREIRARIGTFSSDRRALLSLGVGDVLLPGDWVELSRPTTGRLLFGEGAIADIELAWGARIDCRIREGISQQEKAMRGDRGDESDLSQAKTIKQMRPVLADRLELLEIVVGGVTMSLGEVLQLQPGRVFTLSERFDAPVDLVLDGRTIGRGELIEVEGRLGVRILAMG